MENLDILEKKVYDLLCSSLELIHTRFVAFRNKQSPKVAAVQSNMNIHTTKSQNEKYVENQGFLSCHLCLNAQTQEQHTEPDASYTIIAVPPKISSANENETTNKAKFDFMLNADKVLTCVLDNPNEVTLLKQHTLYEHMGGPRLLSTGNYIEVYHSYI